MRLRWCGALCSSAFLVASGCQAGPAFTGAPVPVTGTSRNALPQAAHDDSEQWGQTFFDAGHAAFDPKEHVLSAGNVAGVKVLWSGGAPGGVTAFALDKGVVFAQDQGAGGVPGLVALNAETGAPKWNVTTGNDGKFLSGGIAAARGLVFAGCGLSYDGNPGGVCAYSASSGKQVWHYIPNCDCEPNGGVSASLAYAKGVVYFGDGGFPSHSDPFVVALDAATGKVLWTHDPGPNALGSGPIAVSGGFVYFDCDGSSGGICALNRSDGTPAWSYVTGNSATALSAYGGVVYAHVGAYGSSATASVVALDGSTGAVLWKHPYGGTGLYASPVAIANGVVYVSAVECCNDPAPVLALRAGTGKRIWSVTPPCTAASSPSVANGVVYVDAAGGGGGCPSVSALRASDGKVLWSNPPNPETIFPPPMVANGKLYVANSTACGTICAYGIPHRTGRLH